MGAGQQALVGIGGAGGGDDFDYTNLLWRVRASDLALSEDDPVTTWEDLYSGSSRDWVGSSSKPVFKTNLINGHPAVFFQAANSRFLTGPDLSGLGLTEIDPYVVVEIAADPPAADASAGLWTLNNAGASQGTFYPASSVPGTVFQSAFLPSGATRPNINPTPTLADWRLLRVQCKTGASNYKMDLDGANLTTSTFVSLEFSAVNELGVSRSSGVNSFLNGWVAEFFAFSAICGAPQYTTIKDYINSFYGLSVA